MENQTKLNFTKMEGAGNDFVLFDNRSAQLSPQEIKELAPVLSDRKFGIGSDGIIALEYDETQQADLVMIYKNPDGSDAGMCGNGARCFAAFATTLGSPESFTFRVHEKVYSATVNSKSVIINFPLETDVQKVDIEDKTYLDVYTNTEHIVCSVSPKTLSNESELMKRGQKLRNHEKFKPAGTNVNFIRGVDRNQLQLQTYERGVENLTLACGTGAIASALAWHYLQNSPHGVFTYTVSVKGGSLTVHFTFDESDKMYSNIKLEGPATFVFEGTYYL